MINNQQHRLADLNARVKEDLSCLNFPPTNWSMLVTTEEGHPVSDVVVIGGGMCGLVAWHALARAGIVNMRIVDRAAKGFEGPWLTYARMETLRSPKTLLGPALGVASLSFRAWYTALYGEAKWEELFRIPRPMWMEYLKWYREIMAIPVENDTDVTRILPRPDGLLELTIGNGTEPPIFTRKLVLATGRDGLGEPTIPNFVKGMKRLKILGAFG